jgi:thiol-disulfide isomerase/thioredoxin
MSRKKTFFIFISIALICLSVGFIAGFFSFTPFVTWKLKKQYEARQNKFLQTPAPLIVTQTVDGTAWSLQDHRGKVILVNFWATWCGPCVQEVPELKELYNKYKNRADFILVGVSLD